METEYENLFEDDIEFEFDIDEQFDLNIEEE